MKITKRQLKRIIKEEHLHLLREQEEGEFECDETCKKMGAEAMAIAMYGLSVSEGGKQALADLTEWLGEAPHDAAKWLIEWTCDGLGGWDGWGDHAGTVGKVCSGLGKSATMTLAIQEKAFWAMAKGIELIPLSMIRDFTADTWPDTEGGKLALADQKKAKEKGEEKGEEKTEKIEERKMRMTKRQLRRIIKEAMGTFTPEAWAIQNRLQLELDNEGQKIIYLDNEQADRLDMPPGVRWDAIRNPAGDGWVIYTGEF